MAPRGEGRDQGRNKKVSSKTRIPVNGRAHSFTHMSRLPMLREVQSSQRTELFIQKCRVCEKHFKLSPETMAPSISDILLDTSGRPENRPTPKPREGRVRQQGGGGTPKVVPPGVPPIHIFSQKKNIFEHFFHQFWCFY